MVPITDSTLPAREVPLLRHWQSYPAHTAVPVPGRIRVGGRITSTAASPADRPLLCHRPCLPDLTLTLDRREVLIGATKDSGPLLSCSILPQQGQPQAPAQSSLSGNYPAWINGTNLHLFHFKEEGYTDCLRMSELRPREIIIVPMSNIKAANRIFATMIPLSRPNNFND